jgi:hypothetical protein
MAAFVECERCGIPLLTSLALTRQALQSAYMMSNMVMRGHGYALNVCRSEKHGCPICGAETPWVGNPPPVQRRPFHYDGTLGEDRLTFLKNHASVHLRYDLRVVMANLRGFSPEYVFAYSALRHFALAGTLSLFNRAVGIAAILSPQSSIDCLRFLCELVNKETGSTLSPYRISVDAFEITGGLCATISFPVPARTAEAHIVGIVTDAKLDTAAKGTADENTNVLFFSLERADPARGFPRTVLGQWFHEGRRNYGFGPNPTLPDFLECVERVWVSEIWKPPWPGAKGQRE